MVSRPILTYLRDEWGKESEVMISLFSFSSLVQQLMYFFAVQVYLHLGSHQL